MAGKRKQRRMNSSKPRKASNRHRGNSQAFVVEALQDSGWMRKLLLGSLALLLVSGVTFAGMQMRKAESFPVRSVQIEGGLEQLDTRHLQQVVQSRLQGNFFSVDIGAIQQAVIELPWAAHVSVRRVWPDVLRIHVDEHVALARWGKNGLLNREGKWFAASQAGLEHLPALSGPEGHQVALVRSYNEISGILQGAGLRLNGLHVDQRRAWVAVLDNDMRLKLGRDHHRERIERFVKMYPRVVAGDAGIIKTVDLRYTNGFAVRWLSQSAESTGLNARGS
jgi:cell division protein FtsQ